MSRLKERQEVMSQTVTQFVRWQSAGNYYVNICAEVFSTTNQHLWKAGKEENWTRKKEMWPSVYKFSPSRRVLVWISTAIWVLEQTVLNEIWSEMIILTLYKYNHWHSSEGLYSCNEIHADSRSAVSLSIQGLKRMLFLCGHVSFC